MSRAAVGRGGAGGNLLYQAVLLSPPLAPGSSPRVPFETGRALYSRLKILILVLILQTRKFKAPTGLPGKSKKPEVTES